MPIINENILILEKATEDYQIYFLIYIYKSLNIKLDIEKSYINDSSLNSESLSIDTEQNNYMKEYRDKKTKIVDPNIKLIGVLDENKKFIDTKIIELTDKITNKKKNYNTGKNTAEKIIIEQNLFTINGNILTTEGKIVTSEGDFTVVNNIVDIVEHNLNDINFIIFETILRDVLPKVKTKQPMPSFKEILNNLNIKTSTDQTITAQYKIIKDRLDAIKFNQIYTKIADLKDIHDINHESIQLLVDKLLIYDKDIVKNKINELMSNAINDPKYKLIVDAGRSELTSIKKIAFEKATYIEKAFLLKEYIAADIKTNKQKLSHMKSEKDSLEKQLDNIKLQIKKKEFNSDILTKKLQHNKNIAMDIQQKIDNYETEKKTNPIKTNIVNLHTEFLVIFASLKSISFEYEKIIDSKQLKNTPNKLKYYYDKNKEFSNIISKILSVSTSGKLKIQPSAPPSPSPPQLLLEKYTNALKKGVPCNSVKHRMTMNSIDRVKINIFFDEYDKSLKKSYIIDPPSAPPSPHPPSSLLPPSSPNPEIISELSTFFKNDKQFFYDKLKNDIFNGSSDNIKIFFDNYDKYHESLITKIKDILNKINNNKLKLNTKSITEFHINNYIINDINQKQNKINKNKINDDKKMKGKYTQILPYTDVLYLYFLNLLLIINFLNFFYN